MKLSDVSDNLSTQLVSALDRALATGAGIAANEVATVHRRHPAMSPKEVRDQYERRFLAVTSR